MHCDGTTVVPIVLWLFGALQSVNRVCPAPWMMTSVENVTLIESAATVPDATPPIEPGSSECVIGMIVNAL
ncbi:hypothetical protein WS79_16035 [Burkholderia territorii]|nr:hypothetical protein WS79_16035 [Burkholderia territorii]